MRLTLTFRFKVISTKNACISEKHASPEREWLAAYVGCGDQWKKWLLAFLTRFQNHIYFSTHDKARQPPSYTCLFLIHPMYLACLILVDAPVRLYGRVLHVQFAAEIKTKIQDCSPPSRWIPLFSCLFRGFSMHSILWSSLEDFWRPIFSILDLESGDD